MANNTLKPDSPNTPNPLPGRVGGVGTGSVIPAPPDAHTNPADYPARTTVELVDDPNPFPWAPEEEIVEPGPGATRAASELVQNYNPYPALGTLAGDEDDIIVHISEVDRETTMYPGPAVQRVREQYARRLEAAEAINDKIRDAIRNSTGSGLSRSSSGRSGGPLSENVRSGAAEKNRREAEQANREADRLEKRAEEAEKDAEKTGVEADKLHAEKLRRDAEKARAVAEKAQEAADKVKQAGDANEQEARRRQEEDHKKQEEAARNAPKPGAPNTRR